MTHHLNRRAFLRATALTVAAGAVGATLPAAQASPSRPVLGTVLDYAAGVPSAAAIKADGHLGAVRYVSRRRPGTESWMTGKPLRRAETESMADLGLQTASVYQFNGTENPDWNQGALGALIHAPQAIALHQSAGGPAGRPIYVAIDSNPTREQYQRQIRPYLQAFQSTLNVGGYRTGVYGNYHVIDWAVADGIGEFFWMHDWGSGGRIHPRTTIHQLPQEDQRVIGGVECDINHVYAEDWGQWTPVAGVDVFSLLS